MNRFRQARYEKQILQIREKLRQTMQNYPDGKITDIIGAQTVYDLMNRAVVLARKAGYTDEQIADLFESADPKNTNNAKEGEQTNTNNQTNKGEQ